MHRLINNVWGWAVDGPNVLWVKPVSFTHTAGLAFYAWVQTPQLIYSLYYKCTQVLRSTVYTFTSVNFGLYPLSTPLTKTTKNYLN